MIRKYIVILAKGAVVYDSYEVIANNAREARAIASFNKTWRGYRKGTLKVRLNECVKD